MIKYLGSKRKLIDKIVAAVNASIDTKTVADLFSGTSRVGHALKRAGYQVTANDHNDYAFTIAQCYVAADRGTLAKEAQTLIDVLQSTEPKAGWFTETYAEKSRYFQPFNAAKIEAIRERINTFDISETMRAVLITSLMEAADRVDSTTGVQMAYLKKWAARSHNPLELRLPEIVSGQGRALKLEANEAIKELDVDLIYIDPPYNQHSYLGNYHIWETLVRWDKPETYGVAEKRIDCKARKSDFNSKRRIKDAFSEIIENAKAKKLLISFSNEGYLEKKEIEAMLHTRGVVAAAAIDYKRYVGAQIGIHNPQGDKVGEISHLRNKEYLFYVGRTKQEVERVITAVNES